MTRFSLSIALAVFIGTVFGACVLPNPADEVQVPPPQTRLHPWETTTTATVVSEPPLTCIPGTVFGGGGKCW